MKGKDELAELIADPSHAADFARRLQSSDSSVRTTFTISQEAIDTLDWLSERMNRTRKDMLKEVLELCRAAWRDQKEELSDTANSLTIEDPVRKPMAIGAGTRSGLNRLSEESGISRDHLAELGIRLARIVAERAIEKQIEPHRKILDDLEELHKHAEAVRSKLHGQVGKDDPVDFALFGIEQTLEEMLADIEREVQTNKPLNRGHQFV